MKRIVLSVFFFGLIVSCSSNDDSSSSNTPVADCNCDRVVEATTFNVVGTPENPAINFATSYTTINDCTDVQREKNHTTTVASEIPKIGQCR
jgi:hypothetical protein